MLALARTVCKNHDAGDPQTAMSGDVAGPRAPWGIKGVRKKSEEQELSITPWANGPANTYIYIYVYRFTVDDALLHPLMHESRSMNVAHSHDRANAHVVRMLKASQKVPPSCPPPHIPTYLSTDAISEGNYCYCKVGNQLIDSMNSLLIH